MLARPKLLAALVAVAGFAALLYDPVERHVAAASLLQAMSSEDRSTPPAFGALLGGLSLPNGKPLRARIYGPSRDKARLSIVLVHGIHHLGVDEPRLTRFARHLADAGCRVLTPELSDLADYRVTKEGIASIQAGVDHLSREGEKVGLIGFSFAGGLSLLAATKPATGTRLRYVASVGGYHDLHRSLRYLATHKVESPTGTKERPAHEYGLLVLLYGHLPSFKLGEDSVPFRAALRSWLMEDRVAARNHAAFLKFEAAQNLFRLVEKQQLAKISAELLELLALRQETLRELSPSGRLKDIHTEVLFLHGASDTVVPPEETLFAEQELMRAKHPSYRTLVTPLLEHVRVHHPGDNGEKFALVGLVSRLL